MTRSLVRTVPALGLAALAAACASDRPGGVEVTAGGANMHIGRASAPPVELNGRWMLSSAAGGQCGMTFASTPGATEGAIRPEGGCPGNFFTSRKWTFEDGALVIRNHNNEPLGKLSNAAPGRFDGQTTAGQPVSLVR